MMRSILFFAALVIAVIHADDPQPPVWPTTDLQITIAGGYDSSYSMKQQKATVTYVDFDNNDNGGYTWIHSINDFSNGVGSVWIDAPKPSLSVCNLISINIETLPPALNLFMGHNFTFEGVGQINNVSVYNWSLTDSIIFTNFYETVEDAPEDRAPFAASSPNKDSYFFFTEFTEVTSGFPPSTFELPDGIECFPTADEIDSRLKSFF